MFPLTVTGAQVRVRGKRLIGPIDLSLSGDGITVVMGPNGAGKTTLLRMLHGLERISDGTLNWACDETLARKNQAFVFQSPIVLRRSVRDNLIYPLRLRGVSHTAALEKAMNWAARIGLEAALDQDATRLSGGERQKLTLARALIAEPSLLLLDEPCAALDGRATREIETILQAEAKAGTRIVMSTHNLGQARRLGREVIFMLAGKVHEMSDATAFFEGPQTDAARAFLKGDIVE